MKKIFSILMTVVMAVTCLAVPVTAEAASKPAKVTIKNVGSTYCIGEKEIYKTVSINWKKLKNFKGNYQVQISRSKKFPKKKVKTNAEDCSKINTKNTMTLTTTNKQAKLTAEKLIAKKKYYIRVRAYKTVKKNGKKVKVYGPWSKVKTSNVMNYSKTSPNSWPDKYADGTPIPLDEKMETPKNIKINVTDTSVEITWTPASTGDLGSSLPAYIDIATDKDFKNRVYGTNTWYELKLDYGKADQYKLKPNTTYYVRICTQTSVHSNFVYKTFKTGKTGKGDVKDVGVNFELKNTTNNTIEGQLIVFADNQEIFNNNISINARLTYKNRVEVTIPYNSDLKEFKIIFIVNGISYEVDSLGAVYDGNTLVKE